MKILFSLRYFVSTLYLPSLIAHFSMVSSQEQAFQIDENLSFLDQQHILIQFESQFLNLPLILLGTTHLTLKTIQPINYKIHLRNNEDIYFGLLNQIGEGIIIIPMLNCIAIQKEQGIITKGTIQSTSPLLLDLGQTMIVNIKKQYSRKIKSLNEVTVEGVLQEIQIGNFSNEIPLILDAQITIEQNSDSFDIIIHIFNKHYQKFFFTIDYSIIEIYSPYYLNPTHTEQFSLTDFLPIYYEAGNLDLQNEKNDNKNQSHTFQTNHKEQGQFQIIQLQQQSFNIFQENQQQINYQKFRFLPSCHPSCSRCFGSSSNECFGCLNSQDYLFQFSCYPSRPDNTSCYFKQCSKCSQTYPDSSPKCKYCQFSRSCSTCYDGDYLLDGDCYKSLPPNSFCDSSNVCHKCSLTCSSCENSSSCLTCSASSPYFYNGQCSSSTPFNTFCDSSKTCLDCDPKCSSCLNLTSCITCSISSPYFLSGNCFSSQPPQTYCNSSKICSICKVGCQTCDSALNCLSCTNSNEFLYQGACVTVQPPHTYCDQNTHICLDCDSSCDTCTSRSSSNCLSCYSAQPYFYQSQCFSSQPIKTYSQQQSSYFICKDCPQGCATCNSDIQCTSCDSLYPYLFKYNCFEFQPAKTHCDENQVCFPCQSPCENCVGVSENECLSCVSQFTLFDKTCSCSDTTLQYDTEKKECLPKTTVLSSEQIVSTKAALSNLGSVSQGIGVVFALSSSFTNSGTAMFSQILTIQKIFYLQLINSPIPDILYQLIDSLASNLLLTQKLNKFYLFDSMIKNQQSYFLIEKGATQKYSSVNLIKHFIPSNKNATIGYKFEKVGLPSSIIDNSGGAYVIGLGVLILQLLIFLLIKCKIKMVIKIYEKILASIFVQALQMIVLILFMSFTIKITHFSFASNTLEQRLEKALTLLSFLVPLLTLFFEFNLIRKGMRTSKVKILTLMKIFEDKLGINCIKDKLFSHSYLVSLTLIECIIFPSVVVFFRSNFQPAIILLIIIQILEFSLTLYLRPFLSKIENYAYIIEQFIWVIIFLTFALLNFFLDNEDPTAKQYSSRIIQLTIIISSLLLIVMIIGPTAQIFNLIQSIRNLIANRRRQKFIVGNIEIISKKQLLTGLFKKEFSKTIIINPDYKNVNDDQL